VVDFALFCEHLKHVLVTIGSLEKLLRLRLRALVGGQPCTSAHKIKYSPPPLKDEALAHIIDHLENFTRVFMFFNFNIKSSFDNIATLKMPKLVRIINLTYDFRPGLELLIEYHCHLACIKVGLNYLARFTLERHSWHHETQVVTIDNLLVFIKLIHFDVLGLPKLLSDATDFEVV
jgi:hypothetical protein